MKSRIKTVVASLALATAFSMPALQSFAAPAKSNHGQAKVAKAKQSKKVKFSKGKSGKSVKAKKGKTGKRSAKSPRNARNQSRKKA